MVLPVEQVVFENPCHIPGFQGLERWRPQPAFHRGIAEEPGVVGGVLLAGPLTAEPGRIG